MRSPRRSSASRGPETTKPQASSPNRISSTAASSGHGIRDDGDVSLQVRQADPGSPRIVGGIVRAGVSRVVLGRQSVRPRANGEFLVVQPVGAISTGETIELEYRAGHHRKVPLEVLAS